ncbi:1-aminocyclopropane-1-carboxylate oxidase-like isoform X2 [Pyrus x bretschneideri]|uniref:1-aminocyclopropane-1-carboxylate oxidase-like isoform X2 n=1 Tax=Pyrus x bretschneideri TaxID=225117 RepID=UPI00202F22DB|nr:1-aminocyclopropane-1-carboxylate oxidase-like isoform X2 [Pyrus x bretschneideri]
MTTEAVNLPIIDLSSSDSISSANSIRQACMECGFFYLVNHGVEEELFAEVFDQSSNFFSLPLEDKLKLTPKHQRGGYRPLFSENLDFASSSKGDSKESFNVGPLDDPTLSNLNQWPSEGELGSTGEEIYGASAHSDYGMVTLLASNGVPGLQVCRDKSKQPRIWEDVLHMDGAFIVNIGDMMERWTNCLFRSTLHRVMPAGQERYSVALFMSPSEDCVVECLKSCCSEESPPRFPPVRSRDYLDERFRLTRAT